jgi:hypothetical protein
MSVAQQMEFVNQLAARQSSEETQRRSLIAAPIVPPEVSYPVMSLLTLATKEYWASPFCSEECGVPANFT